MRSYVESPLPSTIAIALGVDAERRQPAGLERGAVLGRAWRAFRREARAARSSSSATRLSLGSHRSASVSRSGSESCDHSTFAFAFGASIARCSSGHGPAICVSPVVATPCARNAAANASYAYTAGLTTAASTVSGFAPAGIVPVTRMQPDRSRSTSTVSFVLGAPVVARGSTRTAAVG